MSSGWWRRLRQRRDAVLGINERNLAYVYRLNRRRDFRTVDDKLLAKAALSVRGIAMPETLAVVERFRDVRALPGRIERLSGFAVKPTLSSGGKGILLVRRDGEGRLTLPGRGGRRVVEPWEIQEHVLQILSGLLSPVRFTERVFLEQLLEGDAVIGSLAHDGLPDVRVIVCDGRPTMAMLRVPTRESAGRANLHQGAVGVGIDLATGRTVHAIRGNRTIERHPDTGGSLLGLTLPDWHEIVDLARRAADSVPLGYVGVDVIVDRHRGPLVIEINARPGLGIQLANHAGLRQRLREIDCR